MESGEWRYFGDDAGIESIGAEKRTTLPSESYCALAFDSRRLHSFFIPNDNLRVPLRGNHARDHGGNGGLLSRR